MKKLILGMAIAAGSLTFAQQAPAKSSSPITFGVKAGMNVASVTKQDGLDNKAKIGFNAGGFANIPIASSFSIQPEIMYSGLGSKVTSNELTGDTTNGIRYEDSSSLNLNYLTIPVMFQYNLIPNLYVEAGPEFGFMLSGKAKGDQTVTTYTGGSATSVSQSYSEDIDKDHMNTFNVGIGLGAGYYFTPNIGITARYVAGVTDLAKDRESGEKAVHNNVFQVGVAFKF